MDAYAGYERGVPFPHGKSTDWSLREDQRGALGDAEDNARMSAGLRRGKNIVRRRTGGLSELDGEGISCALESGHAAANPFAMCFPPGRKDEKDAPVDEVYGRIRQITALCSGNGILWRGYRPLRAYEKTRLAVRTPL